jgi:hypothetical protein
VRSLRLFLVVFVLAAAAPAAEGAKRDTSPYAGLGTWVDIFATTSWANPQRAVDEMAERGVRTLYLETGNYSQTVDLVRPEGLAAFVTAAHAAGLRVVAWYLPGLDNPRRDLRRALAAIRFRTATGERFDSFALDIEASLVRSVALRNRRLLQLSQQLRTAAGPSYPLGAIIPSAVGMSFHPRYWPAFPYLALARTYDVFLPMAYSTYRVHGSAATFGYVATSVAAIRAAVGDAGVQIHVIGGLSGGMGPAEAAGFLDAVAACAAAGYSLYEFPTTRLSAWNLLVAPVQAPTARACA